MTRRLLLFYVGLAVVILVILEVPLALIGARRERDLAVSQGQKIATGLAIAANEDFEHSRVTDLDRIVVHYRQVTGGEVEIVGSGGRVIATADDDHDNDAAGPAGGLVADALGGVLSGGIVSDEHQPYVVAAAPIGEPGHGPGVVVLSISASETFTRIHLFWGALVGFAAVVLLVALLVGRWMIATLSRPLERLGDTVSALGETDLGIRANSEDGPAEVRALAAQFNQMANRLTELVRAQGRFVADASHQLRSPLTALRLRIENLEAQVPPDGRQAVTAVGDEVQRLSRLVDGLITLGHADGAAPERAVVDVGQVIDERCQSWAALATERAVVLEAPAADGNRYLASLVPGDLDQILDNLLANALDASPPGSEITVRVEEVGAGAFEIHIVDQGPGMSEEHLARAFDRFWQGSDAAGSHGGLGLAIVRQLGVRNDLTVHLASGPGRGLDASVALHRLLRPAHTRRVPTP